MPRHRHNRPCSMNPSDLLASAERLANSGIARVEITSTKQIALLIPPGADEKKQKVKKLPTEVRLIPLPAPPEKKLAIEAKCDNCSITYRNPFPTKNALSYERL